MFMSVHVCTYTEPKCLCSGREDRIIFWNVYIIGEVKTEPSLSRQGLGKVKMKNMMQHNMLQFGSEN